MNMSLLLVQRLGSQSPSMLGKAVSQNYEARSCVGVPGICQPYIYDKGCSGKKVGSELVRAHGFRDDLALLPGACGGHVCWWCMLGSLKEARCKQESQGLIVPFKATPK